jgi:hypothetical protein
MISQISLFFSSSWKPRIAGVSRGRARYFYRAFAALLQRATRINPPPALSCIPIAAITALSSSSCWKYTSVAATAFACWTTY